MRTQFITDTQGRKVSVVLPIKDYEKILCELEELEDIRAFDEAKINGEATIPLRDAIKQRKQRKNA
jgi:hypothetical protein